MNFAIYRFPTETNEIIERLKKRNWIAHAFQSDTVEGFYSPGDIFYNVDVNGVKYTLVLDTNIYQFLLNSYKKPANDLSRDAVALLVFCQMCDIQIDPTFAVYEKINYQKGRAGEAVEDLSLFHKINNSSADSLIPYAVGQSQSYFLGEHPGINEDEMAQALTKHSRLVEWDSLYVVLLACVSISMKPLSSGKKLREFYLWMLKNFRLSFVGLVYGIVYFGERPLKKMMKFRLKDDPDARRLKLANMTWDLYIQNTFFRTWISRDSDSDFAYATADKAFRELLQIGIEVQKAGDPSPLKNMLTHRDYENVLNVWDIKVPDSERVYQSKGWTPEYRTQLIKGFEKDLLR